MGYGYDWMLHEPGAWETEYQGIEHSVEFILSPVVSWERKTQLQMEHEMFGEGYDKVIRQVLTWEEFIGKPSLIAQLSTLAIRGPRPHQMDFDRYEGEYPALLLDYRLVETALYWIWDTFRVRLRNRAELAARDEGMYGLSGLCDAIADRFDFWRRIPELRYESVPPDASFEEGIQAVMPIVNHELNYVIEAQGWNGWEQPAWLQFVGAVDEVRKELAETAREADREREEFERRMYKSPKPPETHTSKSSGLDVKDSYAASEYAESLREAYSLDPDRYRIKGRYAFRPLREASGLTDVQERTVKRWLNYEGNADGFEGFISRLYGVVNQKPPE